jgi:hypothetical protein
LLDVRGLDCGSEQRGRAEAARFAGLTLETPLLAQNKVPCELLLLLSTDKEHDPRC